MFPPGRVSQKTTPPEWLLSKYPECMPPIRKLHTRNWNVSCHPFISIFVSVFLTSAVGQVASFTGPEQIGTFPYPPGLVAAADMNSDGYADLVFYSAGKIGVALSWGDGTFSTPIYSDLGFAGEALALGDFNGDGKLDVAVVDGTTKAVYILYGNSDGTFGPVNSIPLPSAPNSLAASDFNGDGKTDIAALASDGSLSFLKNTGKGFAQTSITVPRLHPTTRTRVSGLLSGDFNGDRRVDLAYVDECNDCGPQSTTSVWVLTNTVSGWVGTEHTEMTNIYLAADFDLDGKMDLAGAHSGVDAVFYSNGDGTFWPVPIPNPNNSSETVVTGSFVAGDFNNDGLADLAALADISHPNSPGDIDYFALAFFAGKGGREGFNAPSLTAVEEKPGPLYLTSGFFTNNGRRDVGFGNSAPYLSVFLNQTQSDDDPCPYPVTASLHICLPIDEHLATGKVRFLASARSHTQPTNRIELWVDGSKVFQVFSDRIDHSLTLSPGNHSAALIEVEANNHFIKKNITFTVDGVEGSCTTPISPGVKLCSPVAGQTYTSKIPVYASATAPTGRVNHMELWIDGHKIGNYFSDQMEANISVGNGAHLLAVVEVDTKGAYIKSEPVRFTASQNFIRGARSCAAPNTPGVNICAPPSGALLSSPVNFTSVGFVGSGSVDHLELWIDGQKVTNYPGSQMSASISLPVGIHSATVVEVDSEFHYVKSNPVSFTVVEKSVSRTTCARQNSPRTEELASIPGSEVQFCQAPANGIPCSNYATIYTDVTATTTASNPITSGLNGYFEVWANPGKYQYTFTYQGLSFGPFSVSVPISDDPAPLLNVVNAIRAVPNDSSPEFDVRAYGAVCNGSASNAGADAMGIQAAINAANAAGGGVVTAPPGTSCYLPSTTSLDMLANVTLRGFSITAASGMTVPMIVTNAAIDTCSVSINNVRVENMLLDGQQSSNVPTASGIAFYCTSNSRADNNDIRNIGWQGIITYTGNKNVEFSGNRLTRVWGDCIHSDGPNTDGVVIEKNVCDAQGIAADGGFSSGTQSSDVVMVGNVVKNLGRGFCYESPGSKKVLIDNNICETGYDAKSNGIRVYNFIGVDSYDITISNNIIGAPKASGYCIDILEPNAFHQNDAIKVIGNRCVGNDVSTGGIYLLGYNIQLKENYVYIPNGSGSCILIDSASGLPSSNINLQNNTLRGCGTGIGGATNAYATNIAIGTQRYIGVSKRTTAIFETLGVAPEIDTGCN